MQHPDEGTIHAWLDGALPAEEARALEAHVAGCAACAAAVSEARGLLAASSRILSALDSVPGGVLPAAAPVAAGDGTVRTVRRASRWHSPGWRAAAAILVVGTVSWLATRSGERSGAATQRAMSTTPPVAARAEASKDTSTPPAISNAAAEPSTLAAASQRGVVAPRPKTGVARVQRNEAPREALGTVAAAPAAQTATAEAEVRVRDSAVTRGATAAAKSQVSGAMMDAMTNRAAAGAAGAVAPMRAEQRLVAPSVMMRGGVSPMAKAIAPASAADVVQRLAGCYALEAGWTVSAAHGESATTLLPARVELTRDRDASTNPRSLVLRPAPGEPAFATGTRGEWTALGGNTVELQIRDDATRRVSATLSIAGDSVSGEARAYAGEPAIPLVTGVKGQRIACPTQ